MTGNLKRGLAIADANTRHEVAIQGGKSQHPHGRGLQNADRQTRIRVAKAGGRHSHDNDQKRV